MTVSCSAAAVLPLELVGIATPVHRGAGPQEAMAVRASAPPSIHEELHHLFALRPTVELPVINLSRTIAKKWFSPRVHHFLVQFMRQHYHLLVAGFRVGAVCFGSLFFVTTGVLHDILLAILVPSTASLFATSIFLSVDVLWLLASSYEFWFTSTINAMNWVAFAAMVADARVAMAFLGWFSFQIVITVDASFRTFPSAVNSMILAIPIVFVLCVFVALRSIRDANFFTLSIDGHKMYDANDIMNFTASTLVILLAKMVVLKKRHVGPRLLKPGYYRLPCVFMKTTLRLVPFTADTDPSFAHPAAAVSSSAPPRRSRQPYHQRLVLSRLPITSIDAYRTMLPPSVWRDPPVWIVHKQTLLRIVLYTLGVTGFVLVSLQTVRSVHAQIFASHQLLAAGASPAECAAPSLGAHDRVRTFAACACSVLFCAPFTLFYQRDMLRLLFSNFDYVFSLLQVVSYSVCVADMLCWQLEYSLVILTWTLWLAWALTIDALTPFINSLVFRLPYKVPAIVLAGVLTGGLGTVYVVLFLDMRGLHNRVLLDVAVSETRSFVLTTRSVMVGRMATIALWTTRQVFVLFRRQEGELCLIRGLIEYDSPYGIFPRKRNKHTPAIDDNEDNDETH